MQVGTTKDQGLYNKPSATVHPVTLAAWTLPQYNTKNTVWCTVWSRGVIGPYCFEDEDGRAVPVKSQSYTEMINEFLGPELQPNRNLWFN